MEQYARGALIGELDDLNPTGFTKFRDALELGPDTKEGTLKSLQGFVLNECGGVHAADADGCTCLHWAARYEHAAELVRWLVAEKKASPDGLTKEQIKMRQSNDSVGVYYNDGVPTPLHEAARYDHHIIAKFLLEAGADPNVPDRDGIRPLHVCAVWNNVLTARCLMEYGADPRVANNDGQTPIDWACTCPNG